MGLLSQRSGDDEEQGDFVLAGLDHLGAEGPDELVYELDEWSDPDRALLRERLESLAVPHRWEGTSLIVAADDEAWVESVMDQVDDELATALDEDTDKVGYDLSGWDDADIDRLVEELTDEAVPHGFEGRELLVHEIDEQRVDEMVRSIAAPGDDSSSPPTADLMGDFFVAADRLARDAGDSEARKDLQRSIERADSAPAPYGMDRLWWDGVQAQATELVVLMEGYDPDEESIIGRAATLRDALRPYV